MLQSHHMIGIFTTNHYAPLLLYDYCLIIIVKVVMHYLEYALYISYTLSESPTCFYLVQMWFLTE